LRTLFDTHALFWWLTDDARLGSLARQVVSDDPDTVHVSVATAWEIAIKVGQGKWPEARWLIENFEREIASEGFALLVAQAASEGLTLVTSDAALVTLGARCLW